MEALRRSVGKEAAPAKAGKPAKNGRKASAGQKEMLMPIEGKKAKEAATKKPQQSRSGDRPDGREAPVTTDRCQACAVRDTKVQTIIRASMSIAGLMEPLGHGPSVEELGGTGNHTIGYLTLQIDIPGTV
ncbi:hypothetical protein XH80_05955 [Bradyrhizobium sp. CCBAU 45384]|nr:hypothetical protein [Bradyrhizobium sp. CCBAU 45384]